MLAFLPPRFSFFMWVSSFSLVSILDVFLVFSFNIIDICIYIYVLDRVLECKCLCAGEGWKYSEATAR